MYQTPITVSTGGGGFSDDSGVDKEMAPFLCHFISFTQVSYFELEIKKLWEFERQEGFGQNLTQMVRNTQEELYHEYHPRAIV